MSLLGRGNSGQGVLGCAVLVFILSNLIVLALVVLRSILSEPANP
jgi:hypothetical protein